MITLRELDVVLSNSYLVLCKTVNSHWSFVMKLNALHKGAFFFIRMVGYVNFRYVWR